MVVIIGGHVGIFNGHVGKIEVDVGIIGGHVVKVPFDEKCASFQQLLGFQEKKYYTVTNKPQK